MLGDVSASCLVHESAAARREHLRPVVQKARDHLTLAVAEIWLAVTLEDFRDRQLGAGLDFRVGVDKPQAELRGQAFADRRLAGAHHADEHDRSPAERRRDPLHVDRPPLNS